MKDELTVVLTHFMRPSNQMRIMSALAGRCRIFVWDNSPKYPFKDSRADWVIRSSVNTYCSGRYWMMKSADTPYVAGLDDDLLPKEGLAEATVRGLEEHGGLVGVAGVRMSDGETYRSSLHVGMGKGDLPLQAEHVDVVKGRYMAAKTEMMRMLPHLPKNLDELSTENDIYVSGCFRGGMILPELCACLTEMPTAKEALHRRPTHWERREEATKRYILPNLQNI